MLEGKDRLTRLYGIDFSGGKDAGQKIWIAAGVWQDCLLKITSCASVKTMFNRTALHDALGALKDFILVQKESIFGIDFPFGLPKQIVVEKTWEDFLLSFPEKYSNDDPDEFRRICSELGKNKEHKRRTDREANSPFCPYNLRIYRQTFHGIRNLLYPLIGEGHAWTLPMQQPVDFLPLLLEICPASTLKEMELYVSYKRSESTTSSERLENRRKILDRIKVQGVQISPAMQDEVIHDDEGDALDSIVAVFAIFRNLLKRNHFLYNGNEVDADYKLEGYIFH